MKLYCIDIQRITYMSYNIFQIQRQIQNTQLSVSIAINQCPISKFKIQNFKILGIP